MLLRAQAEQIAEHYLADYQTGKPSQLGEPDVLQLLLAAVADGLSYDSACKCAGISPRTIYNWKQRAEAGDSAAQSFVQALEKTEAEVERRATRNTLRAGEYPQFWAANMTYLERKYPEKWGRRQDDSSSPRVVVQIGIKDSDVSLSVSPQTFAPDAPT